MAEYRSGAYFINKRGGRRGGRRRGRGAAALVLVLILLTAGICLMVVILPRTSATTGGAVGFAGKKFYFLVSGDDTDYTNALAKCQDVANRGGAGYLYNDGAFKAIAAVYDRESDVNALVSVNAGSSSLMLELPKTECGDGDKAALDYFCGEWFEALYSASTELDRGNATDAAADNSARTACRRLSGYARNAESKPIKTALETAAEYDLGSSGTRTMLAYLRYVTVRAVVGVYYALTDGV